METNVIELPVPPLSPVAEMGARCLSNPRYGCLVKPRADGRYMITIADTEAPDAEGRETVLLEICTGDIKRVFQVTAELHMSTDPVGYCEGLAIPRGAVVPGGWIMLDGADEGLAETGS